MAITTMRQPEWIFTNPPVPHHDAMVTMNERVAAIKNNRASDLIWCLEHPSTYTVGTGVSAVASDTPPLTPTSHHPTIIATGRGGQTTWHGPGQRVCYVMMDIAARGLDAHDYVRTLLAWVAHALRHVGIETFVPDDKKKIGLWVATTPPNQQQIVANKICAIGVRLSPSRLNNQRQMVSSYGVAINVCPNLDNFNKIIPCGIDDNRYGVISVAALGNPATINDIDDALKLSWKEIW